LAAKIRRQVPRDRRPDRLNGRTLNAARAADVARVSSRSRMRSGVQGFSLGWCCSPAWRHSRHQLCKERRRNVAAVRRGTPSPRPIPRDPAAAEAMLRGSRTRQELPLCRQSTGLILAREPLTMTAADDYIDPLGRAAAWRDGASAKPLTVYAVNHPAMSYGYVGCAGFGGFPACRGRGRKASGCLKSESEERETWTAESLRAASSNGEGLA
jgi:hypothetical protein